MNGVPNLLLLHSFSKTYGVPGLRLGYVTGFPSTIQLLRNLRHPWSVSNMAIEAGKFLIKKEMHAVPDLQEYLVEAERLRSQLRQIEGVRVFETKTNYMLCELETASATDLKSFLIHEHGILIRDCTNFYGLSNHFFRVSTQKPEENDALTAAIREYLKQ
jgi:threonine-phosphate decarboxylase